MPNVSIKITNLPQIKSAFAKSPRKMVDELNTAIKKSAIKIQGESMRNAPVLTGRLRSSHTSLFENLKGIVQPNTDYAIYVHEGTRYMKARPFLFDAVQSEEQSVQGYFHDAVQNTLDDLAKGF